MKRVPLHCRGKSNLINSNPEDPASKLSEGSVLNDSEAADLEAVRSESSAKLSVFGETGPSIDDYIHEGRKGN